MGVAIERFAPEPDAGRPKLIEFRGEEGTLALHVDRDTKALAMFAVGPRGGSRGELHVSPTRWYELFEWIEAGFAENFGAGGSYVRITPEAKLVMRNRTASKVFALDLGPMAQEVFESVLHDWLDKVREV